MSNANFVPMYDLERLNADQKAQYYGDACAFLGIPANLNLLAFINANVGDTGRHEVLYAKKGATDLIRQNKGITTIELVALMGLVAGQVCFMAAGRDKDGREERAVGAASVDGLTGKALSDAIMTAQTRATRRMTLQFIGGGILDESELPEGLVTTPLNSVNSEASRALDAITTQPVVVPNPTPSVVDPPVYDRDAMRKLQEQMAIDAQSDNRFVGTEMPPSPAQKAAQDALTAVKPETLAKASGEGYIDAEQLRKTETFKDIKSLAATLPADNPLAQAVTLAPEAPKQRKRKAAEELVPTQANPTPVSASADVPQSQPSTTLPAQPVEPPKVEKKLKPEEEKEIRARLGKYRNEILPAGKMEPIAGVGGVEVQLRTFVQKFYPDKPSSKTWDYADWVYLLNYFDETIKNLGPAGLVEAMQKKIGVRA